MLTRKVLIKIKATALRRRVWFKATSRLERGIVDLTIRCVERIRSSILTRIVSNIIEKITQTFRNDFLKIAEKVGCEIAGKLCRIALEWGNMSASTWRHDVGFIRFLGVNAVNTGAQADGLIG